MPVIRIETNLAADDIKADFRERFTQLVCETLNKPAERITFLLEPGKNLSRGGRDDPMVLVNIGALVVFDNMDKATKDKYSTTFLDFFTKEFGVTDDRVLIFFENVNVNLFVTRPTQE